MKLLAPLPSFVVRPIHTILSLNTYFYKEGNPGLSKTSVNRFQSGNINTSFLEEGKADTSQTGANRLPAVKDDKCTGTDIKCLARKLAQKTPAAKQLSLVICVLDMHYVEMFLNQAASAKRVSVSSLLPVTLNKETHLALLQKGYINYYDSNITDLTNSDESSFRSNDFNRKAGTKFRIALTLLRLGYSVLILDLDTFFVRDPFPFFKCLECDFEIQPEAPNDKSMVVGVAFFRPKPSLIEVLTTMTTRMRQDAKIWDQGLFRQLVNVAKNNIKYHVWQYKLFPTGTEFFHLTIDIYKYDIYKNAVIFHNNWSFGTCAKTYRAKELGAWILDTDGYYSNLEAKYLTYDSPLKEYSKQQVDILWRAFKLAKALNRILILPEFDCGHIKCSLEHVVDMKKFCVDHPGGTYREHYFLKHPYVPSKVKESKTLPIVVKSKSTEGKLKLNKETNQFNPANSAGPTMKEITVWLRQHTDKSIIVFHSMYFNIR